MDPSFPFNAKPCLHIPFAYNIRDVNEMNGVPVQITFIRNKTPAEDTREITTFSANLLKQSDKTCDVVLRRIFTMLPENDLKEATSDTIKSQTIF